MKFCTRHWEALRTAIKDRGLDGLVAKSGEEVVKRLSKELDDGESHKSTFEPLMGAHNAIVMRALDIVGLNLMARNDDGSDRCPICYLQASHDEGCKEEGCKHSFEPWIVYAADDARKEAVRLGLMAEA
jgi:hypothetical protein